MHTYIVPLSLNRTVQYSFIKTLTKVKYLLKISVISCFLFLGCNSQNQKEAAETPITSEEIQEIEQIEAETDSLSALQEEINNAAQDLESLLDEIDN